MHSVQCGCECKLARASGRVRLAQPQGRWTSLGLGEAGARAWQCRDPKRRGLV